MLDSIESDDEGDIENIMNDSDTEFVAEDESVISTNIIRKEEIGDHGNPDDGSTPFDVFQTVTGMNELLEIIVT